MSITFSDQNTVIINSNSEERFVMIELAAATEIMSRKHSKNAAGYDIVSARSPTEFEPSTPSPAMPDTESSSEGPRESSCEEQRLFDSSAEDDQKNHQKARRTAHFSRLGHHQTVHQNSVHHFQCHSSVIRPPPNVTITPNTSRENPSIINNTVKHINQRWKKYLK